jgi:hypothetical protein
MIHKKRFNKNLRNCCKTDICNKIILLKVLLLFFLFLWQTPVIAQVSVTIGSGDSLKISEDMRIFVSGNWTNNGIFTAGNSTVYFDGIGTQTISHASAETFNKIEVDKSAGDLQLNCGTSVTNELTLTSGKITSYSAYPIIITSSGTVNGGSDNSFVDGPMVHTFASSSSSDKTFPIGKEDSYRPITLTITHDASTETQYTAEVFNQASATRNLPEGIDNVSSVRYWNVAKGSGANVLAASITLNYDTDDGVSDASYLRVLKDDGAGNWNDLGGTGTAAGSGSITSTTNFTLFSDFTLGNAVGGDNPLPILLASISVKFEQGRVILEWETASEFENAGFEIYRSFEEGGNYSLISSFLHNPELVGQGNTSSTTHYSLSDEDVNEGDTLWYKLADISNNGVKTFHNAISISIPIMVKEFRLSQNYPNPFNPTTTIEFDLPHPQFVTLNIYNVIGEKVATLVSEKLTEGKYKYEWNTPKYASGVYMYRLQAGEYIETKKMVLMR